MNNLFGKKPWLPELYGSKGIGLHSCGIPISFNKTPKFKDLAKYIKPKKE